MFKDSPVFCGFSVNDQAAAKKFYGEVLGLDVTEDSMGLELKFPNGTTVFIYQKDDHLAATYTVMNFPVDNIDAAVRELKSKGVQFTSNEMTDADNIARGRAAGMGPDIAWFTDPAGNYLSVLHADK